MKLPSFQFYPADWRKDPGVQSLEYHDRGVWFEMICLMHESDERGKLLLNGKPMPESALSRMLGLDKQILTTTLTTLLTHGVASKDPETGALCCRRMVRDEELRKIRQSSGKLGGNPVLLNQKPTTRVKQIPTPSSSSSSSDIAGERAGAVESARPSWEEVKVFADRIGLAEWKARDWLDEMLTVGWLDYRHRPVLNWQPMITRVKVKWETDGRPMTPPVARTNGHTNGNARQPFISELKTILGAKEDRIAKLRFEHADEEDGRWRWRAKGSTEQAECAALVKEVEELKKKLAEVKV